MLKVDEKAILSTPILSILAIRKALKSQRLSL